MGFGMGPSSLELVNGPAHSGYEPKLVGLICKTRENFIFSEKGQNGNFAGIVQAKTWKFSRSRVMKRTSPLNSSHEI